MALVLRLRPARSPPPALSPRPAPAWPRPRRHARALAAASSTASNPDPSAPPSPGGDLSAASAPWAIAAYYSKRTDAGARTDALGAVPEEELATLAAPPGWTTAGKLSLAVRVVARDMGLPEAVVRSRLDSLAALLPDLAGRFETLRAGDLARLAADLPTVATRLVALRGVFPGSDVSMLVARRPEVLSWPTEEVAARAQGLRALLGPGADRAAAAQPRLLDVEATERALAELQRLYGPDADVAGLLCREPALLTSVEVGPQARAVAWRVLMTVATLTRCLCDARRPPPHRHSTFNFPTS